MVELLVGMILLAIAMSMVSVVLISTMRAQALSQGRSDANEQARAAVRNIDRQVRSGNIVYDPAKPSVLRFPGDLTKPNAPNPDPEQGHSLLVYTQSNGDSNCVLWQVDNHGRLHSWSWDPDSDDQGQPPRHLIATGVVNKEQGTAPFALGGSGHDGLSFGNLLTIDFFLDAGKGSRPVEISTSVEGRNTSFDYPANKCAQEPS